jgi:hypothetical protein
VVGAAPHALFSQLAEPLGEPGYGARGVADGSGGGVGGGDNDDDGDNDGEDSAGSLSNSQTTNFNPLRAALKKLTLRQAQQMTAVVHELLQLPRRWSRDGSAQRSVSLFTPEQLLTWLKSPAIFGGPPASSGRRRMSAAAAAAAAAAASQNPRIHHFSTELSKHMACPLVPMLVRYLAGMYDASTEFWPSVRPSSSLTGGHDVARAESTTEAAEWISKVLEEGIFGAVDFLEYAQGMIRISDGIFFHSVALGCVPSLPRIVRPGMYLRSISLRHCSLVSLDPFFCCHQLEELNVSDNRIALVPAALLVNLSQLRLFNGDYNIIERVECREAVTAKNNHHAGSTAAPAAAVVWPKLEELSLSHNNLEACSGLEIVYLAEQFAPILVVLDLGCNTNICEFPLNFLKFKPWLRSVCLIGNNFMSPRDARKLGALRCASLEVHPPVVFGRAVRAEAGEAPRLTFRMALKFYFAAMYWMRIFFKIRMERALRALLEQEARSD